MTESNKTQYLAKYTVWLLDRIKEEDHGCLTGDCPHEYESECITKLLYDFQKEPDRFLFSNLDD